ncbi:phage baseplate assembly protein V [Bacillus horti]|uniref:Uncharacterized protein involved in type VI secretion and phage assembly n=1 Tax=Caldalkalibacillus horti TaxID=77523 RepID=A0ABT9W0E4_9BACI|nr:phage baseplate assembly protein V [Bacillus horti]MDQ0166565.1 uncharacterized protein involved in type VI secretion and phage assembly [Bacillus horti]
MTPFSSFTSANAVSNHRVDGVMIGVVTDNNDPEGLARVRLNLPGFTEESETDWVRIATMMAGKDRGSLFIPEVGDEVLVAFHLGDIRSPFVIGALWTEESESPKSAEGNNVRKLKSRSGHEIIFDDDDAEGKVTILSSKGHKLELDDKNDQLTISEQSSKNQIEIKGGSANEIVIKSDSTTISLDAQGQVKIESNQKVTIQSADINIEAKAQLNLKASGAMNLKSDGLITIKGSMVKIN